MATAIEWLQSRLKSLFENDENDFYKNLFNQAKEMEKQQMFDYIMCCYVNGENSLKFHQEEFEKYYNKKFGKQNTSNQ